MKLTDKVESSTHRVIVYGAPKAGKTEFVSKLAAKYKLLWFDLENGHGTLLKLPSAMQENIELIALPDSRVFPIAIETMMKVISGNKCEICEEHGKVACPMCRKDGKPTTTVELGSMTQDTVIVVDSLTQLTNSGIAFITKGKPDDYKMEFDDWGNLKTLVEKFLSQVQAARYNIVCISHEEEVEMEDGRKKLVPVCGSSKSSRNTAKYFDHVLYCEVKNRAHGVGSSTTFSNNILTGSRTDVVTDGRKDASILDIFGAKVQRGQSNGETALSALKSMGVKR